MYAMKVALIIPAAGASRRYTGAGAVRSKLDEDLGGRPVLQRTIELFAKHESISPLIGSIIVAGPHDADSLDEFKLRHADRIGLMGGIIIRGGETHRYETVAAALAALSKAPGGSDCTHAAIHDAARPCTSPELIERIFAAAEKYVAVIPAVEMSDTIKRTAIDTNVEEERDPLAAILGPDPDLGQTKKSKGLKYVRETLNRDHVVRVQTPQIFELSLLKRAYAQKDLASTDDAQLVERLGERVVVVEGEALNIKITRPEDLRLARAILGVRPPEDKPAHKRF